MFSQLLINSLIATSVYTLVAVSFSLIYSTTRFFHFAHAVVFTAGAYFAYLFYILLGLPLVIAVVLSVAASAVLGSLIELYIYRPLRKTNASAMVLLLASLGVYIVLQNLISMIFGDDTKSIRTGDVVEGLDLLTPVHSSLTPQ